MIMEMTKPATSQIPVGFRFYPTDEEIVIHYLTRKVYSLQLPANVIPEFDVFETSPWDLPGELREKRYFFSKTRMDLKYESAGGVSAGSGYWKAIGKEKKISVHNQTIGMKKILIFYKDKCTKTRWIMHQYFLVGTSSSVGGEWFVCAVFRRKRKPKYHFKKKGRPEISFDDDYDQDQEGSSDCVGLPSS